MTPYPEYKETGLAWLPQIPKHWGIHRTKSIFRLISESAPINNNCELLSVYTHIGVRPRKTLEAKGNRASTTDGYWIVKKGDIVCNKLLAWMGAIGVSHFDGVTSPAYDIIRKRNSDVNTEYYHYLFRLPQCHSVFRAYSRGIMDMRLRLYFDQFGQILIPIPPADEQTKIVRYLDVMTAKINKLIRAKKKQIALLQEQKQAIINQAVTKGLNPDVEMKDSGIDWLGPIPKHWEVKRVKRICKVNASVAHLLKSIADDSEVTFLPMENISANGTIDCSLKQKLNAVKSGFTAFAKDDVVVAKITPCFENGKGACLNTLETAIGFGTTELIVLRAYINEVTPAFLYLITRLTVFRKKGAEVMTGSAGQKRVPAEFIANFLLAIPCIEEQTAIVKYLDQRCRDIDAIISQCKKEIALATEYKNSLISSAVTGQIDLRNVEMEAVIPDDSPGKDDSDLESDDESEESSTPTEESEE